MGKRYDQLDLDDRIEISQLHAAGKFRREIGHLMGRNRNELGPLKGPNLWGLNRGTAFQRPTLASTEPLQ